MSFIGKYRWFQNFLGLSLLKKGLHYRVRSNFELSLKDLPAGVRMVNRVDFILDYCRDKSVLHIGFADHPFTAERIKDGSLLHIQLKHVADPVMGFDNDQEAINEYTSLTGDTKAIVGDLMKLESLDLNDTFDIILLGEVLEHLRDPHKAIENLYNTLPGKTIFLVSVPNYTSLDSLGGSLHQKESIHPDHYWYFSSYTLLKLFPSAKFDLLELVFGMYYQKGKDINFVLRQFPFMGDCIIGVFKSKK